MVSGVPSAGSEPSSEPVNQKAIVTEPWFFLFFNCVDTQGSAASEHQQLRERRDGAEWRSNLEREVARMAVRYGRQIDLSGAE